MQAVFVDAAPALADIAERQAGISCLELRVHRDPDVLPDALAEIIGDASIALIDHTVFPMEVARRCPRLQHVIFLGTGARSYMSPEDLLAAGIRVHTISGYGDVAVAEMTVALMWAAAKSIGFMDRHMRQGEWLRTDGLQLTGKTIGLVGFGNIARAVAPLVPFMRILAWNRTLRRHAGVEFVDLETLLCSSDVVSLHLGLNDETRGFLSEARLAQMRRGAILVNTARGALVDEAAMIARLRSGALRHAALDVFTQEPLPKGHPLLSLENVTLSAHSAFRTSEASENLIRSAMDIWQSLERG